MENVNEYTFKIKDMQIFILHPVKATYATETILRI